MPGPSVGPGFFNRREKMEEKQQSVILKIGSDYYSLTPAEKRLADFILANQEKVVQLSISELARASAVAEATVSRFSRHMGYKSFPLLKLAVANATAQARLGDTPLSGQVEPQDDLPTMAQKLYRANTEAMLQTMEVLDLHVVAQVATLFQQAKQVLCMGQGGSMLIAREAAHLFSTVSNKFRPVEDSHMQAMAASVMDAGEVIFFFSYSGSTRDVLEITSVAQARGLRLRDMPEDWFSMPGDEALQNAMTAAQGVLVCNRLVDEGRLAEADWAIAHLLAVSRGLPGLYRGLLVCDRVTVELLGERPCDGDVDWEKHAALEKRCKAAYHAVTGKELTISPGSTDCNTFLNAGIPCFCIGAMVGEGAHTREEWLYLSSLKNGLHLAARLLLG